MISILSTYVSVALAIHSSKVTKNQMNNWPKVVFTGFFGQLVIWFLFTLDEMKQAIHKYICTFFQNLSKYLGHSNNI